MDAASHLRRQQTNPTRPWSGKRCRNHNGGLGKLARVTVPFPFGFLDSRPPTGRGYQCYPRLAAGRERW